MEIKNSPTTVKDLKGASGSWKEMNEETLEKMPKDLRVEISENKYRKNCSEKELAEVQNRLKEESEKESSQGERNDPKD